MVKRCDTCGKETDMLSWETTCWKCRDEKELNRIKNEIAEAEPGDEVDTFSSQYVICPYCGTEIEARIYGYCDFPEAYEEGDHEIRCDECGKTYKLSTEVTYSWETHKIEQK